MKQPENETCYNVVIGNTVVNNGEHSNDQYHILQYNVKPKTLDTNSPAYISKSASGGVNVQYNHSTIPTEKYNYSGTYKTCKDFEFLLIFEDGHFRLEKQTSSSSLLKRDNIKGVIPSTTIIPDDNTTTSSSSNTYGSSMSTALNGIGNKKKYEPEELLPNLKKSKQNDVEFTMEDITASENLIDSKPTPSPPEKKKAGRPPKKSGATVSAPLLPKPINPPSSSYNNSSNNNTSKYKNTSTPTHSVYTLESISQLNKNNNSNNNNFNMLNTTTTSSRATTKLEDSKSMEELARELELFDEEEMQQDGLFEKDLEDQLSLKDIEMVSVDMNNGDEMVTAGSSSGNGGGNLDDDADIEFEEFPVQGNTTSATSEIESSITESDLNDLFSLTDSNSGIPPFKKSTSNIPTLRESASFLTGGKSSSSSSYTKTIQPPSILGGVGPTKTIAPPTTTTAKKSTILPPTLSTTTTTTTTTSTPTTTSNNNNLVKTVNPPTTINNNSNSNNNNNNNNNKLDDSFQSSGSSDSDSESGSYTSASDSDSDSESDSR